MLKLIFDAKCGYEEEFVTILDYELDISFLAKPSFYKKLALLSGIPTDAEASVPTENELYVEYLQNPEQLIRDYGLGTVILSVVTSEVGKKHFREILDPKTSPIVFPELFTVRNFSLMLTDEKSTGTKDIIDLMLNLTKQEQDVEKAVKQKQKEKQNQPDEVEEDEDEDIEPKYSA